MIPKYAVGDLVRTIPGSPFDVEGIVTSIIRPTPSVVLLWGGEDTFRYEIHDTVTGEYLQVIERSIEQNQPNRRRRRPIPNRWQ